MGAGGRRSRQPGALPGPQGRLAAAGEAITGAPWLLQPGEVPGAP